MTGIDISSRSPFVVEVVAAQLCAPVPGGTGRYTAELVRALSKTATGNDRVFALAPRGCDRAHDLGVEVEGLPASFRVLARLWERGLPPRAGAAQVVHAPTLLVPPVRKGAALVVTIHDVVPWTHPETLSSRGVSFHQRMARRAGRDADLIITPTRHVARQVERLLNPTAPVVAVLAGASHLPEPQSALLPPHLAARPYVLFVGTAEPRKGLDTLVAAMSSVQTSGLTLVVVGPSGWGDVNVADLAARAGISDRVLVTGRVSDAQLATLYAHAGCVAMPSRAEGFGLPVVEAMSFGVPAVTSSDPALVEVGGGATLVVPVDDHAELATQLAVAVAPGPVRSGLVERGSRRVQQLGWEKAGRELWRVYRSL